MAVTRLTTNGLTGTKYDIASADNYYMEPIATTLVGSTTNSVTINNIPSGYKNLQLRWILQLTNGSGELDLRFNSDSGTNYSYHRIYGQGTSAVAEAGINTAYATVGYYATATSVFNGAVIDILDYSNTNKFKTVRSLNGMDTNGGGLVLFDSSCWRNTAPITSITIFSKDTNRDLAANSRISLYGIKG
jgi:hypothetical protein